MTVYVDNMRARYGRMIMCHMLADSREELFAMADRIGVARRWYQGFEKASCPHFDIALSKRALAIRASALEVSRAELRAVMARIKATAILRVQAGEPHGWEANTNAIITGGRNSLTETASSICAIVVDVQPECATRCNGPSAKADGFLRG